MLWGLYTLGFDWEANDFFYFIRDVAGGRRASCRSCTASAASASSTEEMLDAPRRLRAAPSPCASATAPTTSSSTTSGARCWTRSTCTRKLARRAARVDVADPRAARSSTAIAAWREPDRGIWEVRGEPKHFASLEGHVLGRLRPRRAPGAPARGLGARRALAGGRRRDPRRRARERRRRPRRVRASTTTPTRWTPRACCSSRSCASCPPTTSAIVATVNAIADELTSTGWCCATAPTRPTTACRARRARSPSARSGWSARWPRSASTTRARALCERMLGYASPLHLYAEEIDASSGPPPGQLPAGVHPPGAHQRGHARDPRRPRAGAGPAAARRRRKRESPPP